jgi:hypothetical protein
MIKAYSTLAGARRAAPGSPILRILNNPANDDSFIAGIDGSTSLMAVDPKTGRADGVISMLDLMAGATFPTNNPAALAVLSAVPVAQADLAGLDMTDALRFAGADALAARSGDLESRRNLAVKAAARLIAAVEMIDAELAR